MSFFSFSLSITSRMIQIAWYEHLSYHYFLFSHKLLLRRERSFTMTLLWYLWRFFQYSFP